MLWASGGGLIPVPILDIIAITAVDVKMLRELSALYELPFREHQVKSILASLLAGWARRRWVRRSPPAYSNSFRSSEL